MARDPKLEDVLYYLIEKSNKVTRRYSQERFVEAGLDITIDQWVMMKKISDSERITQVELAESLFKDTASITRTLEILEKKKLIKKFAGIDKRSYELELTEAGQKFIEKAMPLVKSIRKKGVEGLTEGEVETVRKALSKMIKNLS